MRKKIIKPVLFVFLATLLLVSSSHWIVKPIISDHITQILTENGKGLYSFQYEKMSIGIFPPGIKLSNIELSPDGSKLSEIKVKKLYNLEASDMEILSNDIFALLMGKRIWIKAIHLKNPLFKIVSLPFDHSDLHIENTQHDSILLKIDHLEIKNGAVLIYNFGKNEVELSIENFKIQTKNIVLKNEFKLENLHFENLVLSLQNLVFVNDSLYSTSIKNIKISQELNIAEIEKMHYSPRIGKYQIAKQYQKNIHWNSFDVEALVFEQLDLEKLMQKKLKAHKIYLEKPVLNIFSNNNYAADSSSKEYLLTNIYSNEHNFKIDTIDIHKGNILIETFLPQNRLPQQIHFTELSGFVSDVWLSKDSSDEKTSMHAQLKGYFQRVIPFSINSYPSHYPFNWKHSGNADFSSFKLARVGKLLQNEYNLEILGGECNSLKFDFHFEHNTLEGEFLFSYQNLDFQYQAEAGKANEALKRKGIYKKSNPGILQSEAKKEIIFIERKAHQDIIDIWRTGIEKGIKKTVYPLEK